MFKVIILVACIYLACAQYLPGYENSIPNPYQFSYGSPSIGGESTHQEQGDGQGRVTGSYTVADEDGRSRVVEYVADEFGFRATVRTNEPGTSDMDPANVDRESAADDGGLEDGEGITFNRAVPGGALPVAAGVLPVA